MASAGFSFSLIGTDPSGARRGVMETPHGRVETPVFMPVGTAAAMKAMTTDQLAATGADIVLANAYHLWLQPGADLVEKLGGLHAFMGWDGPILTDSGGFQVFSLPGREVDEEGVRFRPRKNEPLVRLTPALSIQVQNQLGADIIMAFDECVEYPASYAYTREGLQRTLGWAEQCRRAHARSDQALFGISQGGLFEDLRQEGIRALTDMGFSGYALGGLSVGEGIENMKRVLDFSTPLLPDDKPRYVMGIGLPEDVLAAVERGVDMMDCIIPTRFARSATLITHCGKIRVSNRAYRRDRFPPDTNCDCDTCRRFSRAYLHHLFAANEILGAILVSVHNVRFYMKLMADIRQAIEEKRFSAFKREFLSLYQRKEKRK